METNCETKTQSISREVAENGQICPTSGAPRRLGPAGESVAISHAPATIRRMGNRIDSALFSVCGEYRYELSRFLGPGPTVTFLMLNPSIADATVNDHTVRKCMGFARAWQCGRLLVVNLFAFRATAPRDLLRAQDPVGPRNPAAVHRAMRSAEQSGGLVVCAWGTHGTWRDQHLLVAKWLQAWPAIRPMCLGFTRNGQPKHPLRLPYTTELLPWSPTNPASQKLHSKCGAID